jgi:predicted membrane protein
VNGANATVTIKQPSGVHGGGGKHYLWDLQLNDNVLTDLTVNCGAGEATLTVGDVLLRSLHVRMGAGKIMVDLGGAPRHDYQVTINGGVGQSVIRLPQGVGIYLTASKGIGALNVTGLQKQGGHWENDLYNKANVTVKVDVNGGIGQINISA